MPKRSRKNKPDPDENVIASRVVAEATGEDRPKPRKKNPAAVALGRLGGLKGGPIRARRLSKKRRQEIARRAAQARWAKAQ